MSEVPLSRTEAGTGAHDAVFFDVQERGRERARERDRDIDRETEKQREREAHDAVFLDVCESADALPAKGGESRFINSQTRPLHVSEGNEKRRQGSNSP